MLFIVMLSHCTKTINDLLVYKMMYSTKFLNKLVRYSLLRKKKYIIFFLSKWTVKMISKGNVYEDDSAGHY